MDIKTVLQKAVGLVPDTWSGGSVEQFGDAEVTLQFEMCPMVERITQGVWDCAGPGEELLIRGCVARAISLRLAIDAHGTPFVVIAFQPYFEEVVESPVFGNLTRGEMAVVVEDWLRSGIGLV